MSVRSGALFNVIISQFFSSFIEYALKLMVFTLATRSVLAKGGLEISSQHVATLAAVAFLIPMLLFSFPAGILVDRFCKRTMILATKAIDIFCLVLVSFCLYVAPGNIVPLFVVLGLLGVSGALFNPAKGSLLPEILSPDKLGSGNGWLEMWTMLAVFAGHGLGPVLLAADCGGVFPANTWIGPALLAVLASASLVSAYFLPKTVKRESCFQGLLKSTAKGALKAICNDVLLGLMLLGNIVFWVVITYFGQNVLVETKSIVTECHLSEMWQGLPLAAYWLGIAIGSIAGGRLSIQHIKSKPLALAVAWFGIIWVILRWLHPGFAGLLLILVSMGLAAGFLIVPIMAVIQHRAPGECRGCLLSINNILNILGILCGSYLAMKLA